MRSSGNLTFKVEAVSELDVDYAVGAFVFLRSFKDRVGISDSLCKSVDKGAKTTAAMKDSGVAFIQSYSEPGYFLDDYTGTSRGW